MCVGGGRGGGRERVTQTKPKCMPGIKDLYRTHIVDKQQPEDLAAFCCSDTIEPQVPALAILRMFPQLTPELVSSYEHPRLIIDKELPFKGRVLNLISKLRVTPGCYYRNRSGFCLSTRKLLFTPTCLIVLRVCVLHPAVYNP